MSSEYHQRISISNLCPHVADTPEGKVIDFESSGGQSLCNELLTAPVIGRFGGTTNKIAREIEYVLGHL
tara:strand:+ start:324 stop:530 length:207 start_codon:yes stop_codon:yes gene_type:complete